VRLCVRAIGDRLFEVHDTGLAAWRASTGAEIRVAIVRWDDLFLCGNGTCGAIAVRTQGGRYVPNAGRPQLPDEVLDAVLALLREAQTEAA
jgi:hypothetical protein